MSQFEIEIRCPDCGKLLMRATSGSSIEIICPRCSAKVVYPVMRAEVTERNPKGKTIREKREKP